MLAAWAFSSVTAGIATLTRARQASGAWRWSPVTPVAAVLAGSVLGFTGAREITWLSWLGVACLWIVLLHIGLALVTGARLWRAALFALGLACSAAIIPMAALQLHERFSTEEAFAVLQAALLGLSFLLLFLPIRLIASRVQPPQSLLYVTVRRRWLSLILIVISTAILIVTFRAYQASFFDPDPPAYPGISADSPFLCLNAPESETAYEGEAVFHRLLAGVERNPNKQAPEYGMLALGTHEKAWAERFRDTLLEEARAGKFTGPSNSVKYRQYEASLRAYYLPLVQESFPNLFSENDRQLLKDWFAGINRRALTVEWSDLVYASALGEWPTGLYENQENGAGLVANLLVGGLAAPDLTEENRRYLETHPRGWLARFRNTDDAFVYQPEWIDNAMFQAEWWGGTGNRRQSLSFEWLLLQALPNGQPPSYNFPKQPSLAGVAYLAALQLGDPRFVWLAGRALDEAEESNRPVFARPGVEQAIQLTGTSPRDGSCLIYGDSGLPTRSGPLAPDKVVFRSGWQPDDAYALLNLRFTGWHRYKATNTISLISLGSTIVADKPGEARFAWLPEGRSLFRDKRIRREDLNGLLVPTQGLSEVLQTLTGFGTRWAQDPPWHAEPVQFGQDDAWQFSQTRLVDWHGWQHDRWTYLHRDGDIVVVADQATGPHQASAFLSWRLDGEMWTEKPGPNFNLTRGAGSNAECVIVLPLDSETHASVNQHDAGDKAQSVLVTSAVDGTLSTVTVFLAGDAVNIEPRLREIDGRLTLVIGEYAQLELDISDLPQ